MRRVILFLAMGLLFTGCGDDASPTSVPDNTSPNNPPEIAVIGDLTATLGLLAEVEIMASDPDGDTVELLVSVVITSTELRSGVSVDADWDSESAVLSFMPRSTDMPSRGFSVTAIDARGLKTDHAFSFEVSAP